jgi:hypothetical protein
MITAWIFTVLLIFPSGEEDRRQAVFETLAACEGERQRVWLHMIQTDPLVRVESRCQPVIKQER